jgi:hypothetical protein
MTYRKRSLTNHIFWVQTQVGYHGYVHLTGEIGCQDRTPHNAITIYSATNSACALMGRKISTDELLPDHKSPLQAEQHPTLQRAFLVNGL